MFLTHCPVLVPLTVGFAGVQHSDLEGAKWKMELDKERRGPDRAPDSLPFSGGAIEPGEVVRRQRLGPGEVVLGEDVDQFADVARGHGLTVRLDGLLLALQARDRVPVIGTSYGTALIVWSRQVCVEQPVHELGAEVVVVVQSLLAAVAQFDPVPVGDGRHIDATAKFLRIAGHGGIGEEIVQEELSESESLAFYGSVAQPLGEILSPWFQRRVRDGRPAEADIGLRSNAVRFEAPL